MNEADLATYCRQRGLYAEQIQAWRTACEQANDWERASSQRLGQATKEEKTHQGPRAGPGTQREGAGRGGGAAGTLLHG